MRYDLVLMDADDTLFDYPRAAQQALEGTCRLHGLPFDDAVLARYHRINDALWKRHERGEVTQERLRTERFDTLAAELGTAANSAAMNRDYSRLLGEGAFLLPGALELCRALAPLCPLYIVTNGLSDTQHRRLAKSGLSPYLSGMFISEEVGYQKPRPEFFDAVFAAVGLADRRRAVILGDSQTSDMQGGKNAGIDTCWFAPPEAEDRVGCTWRVSRLEDFLPIVTGR